MAGVCCLPLRGAAMRASAPTAASGRRSVAVGPAAGPVLPHHDDAATAGTHACHHAEVRL